MYLKMPQLKLIVNTEEVFKWMLVFQWSQPTKSMKCKIQKTNKIKKNIYKNQIQKE